ncbi:hypothetical protein GCM10010286_57760 [Streptomyces toxytricini]|nr:hypothetical protein GCM10010286_57760 [Streptomyces toxytricini]
MSTPDCGTMARMNDSAEQAQTADRLWQEHRQEPFPDSLRQVTFDGTDVWLLEWGVAGSLVRRLDHGRPLDAEDRALLQSCIDELDRVIPEMSEPAGAHYCRRLLRLAALVLGNTLSASVPVPGSPSAEGDRRQTRRP